MTERITPEMQSSVMLANINTDLAAVDHTQSELSTGLQITQPSDNPYATALAMQLSGQVAAMQSYSANIGDGTAWANSASTALQTVQQNAESARTLIVEGANAALNANDRSEISSQISDIVDAIKATANTQYDGMYIFSGTATSTAPYLTGAGASDAFQGNTDAINRTIGPAGTPTLQVNVDLSSVLNDSASGSGLLTTLEQAASDLASGSSNISNDLSDLDTNMGALEGIQATVGATQDRLSSAASRISSFQMIDQTALANTEDVDMASASISYSTEQAAYTAALQTGAQIVQTSLVNFVSH